MSHDPEAHPSPGSRLSHWFVWISLSLLAAAAMLILEGRKGFGLSDEGFLWYGVQRVLAGDVPLRDFMAYDPGRYYAAAALMKPWANDGIFALRTALAVVQSLALCLALALVMRGRRGPSVPWLALSLVTLAVWMFPRHRMFDITISLLLMFALTLWVARPTMFRCVTAGVVVGLAAVFGKNHGVYGAVASLGVIAYLAVQRPSSFPRPLPALLGWAAGMLLGYSPILIMAALVPGFAARYWESIRYLLETRSTNLPLPVPWPWLISFSAPLLKTVHGLFTGAFFVAVAAYAVSGLPWAMRAALRKQVLEPARVSSAVLALPYAHFAFSRADVDHLAQGVFPLLIGALLLADTFRRRGRWLLVMFLCGASLIVMTPKHPVYQCGVVPDCVETSIGRDRLLVDRRTTGHVDLVQRLSRRFAPEGESFVVVPYWPGAYAMMRREAPLWSIYALFPRSRSFQEAEIERIRTARPAFAIIDEHALDGREERRFARTHPAIHRYLLEHFVEVPGYSVDPEYRVLVAKDRAR